MKQFLLKIPVDLHKAIVKAVKQSHGVYRSITHFIEVAIREKLDAGKQPKRAGNKQEKRRKIHNDT